MTSEVDVDDAEVFIGEPLHDLPIRLVAVGQPVKQEKRPVTPRTVFFVCQVHQPNLVLSVVSACEAAAGRCKSGRMEFWLPKLPTDAISGVDGEDARRRGTRCESVTAAIESPDG